MGAVKSKEKVGKHYHAAGLQRRYGYVSQFHDPSQAEAPRAATPIPGAYKILSIGINYSGTRHQLASSVIDTHNQMRFLKRRGFVPSGGFRCLTDDGRGDMMPTFENIIRSLLWLVEGAEPGHSMYLHFSGHSVLLNGLHEHIAPMDFAERGAIRCDAVAEILSKTPPGARVVVVADCSYACSMVPLPWRVTLGETEFRWFQDRQAQDLLCGQIVVISGAKPDTEECVAGTGALTTALIKILDTDATLTFEHLMRRLRQSLHASLGTMCKLPSIASSHKFDLQENFSLGMAAKDRLLLSSYRQSTRVGGSGVTLTHNRFFIGARVESYFHTAWFPAIVRNVNDDGTYDLDWEDGTSTMAVDGAAVRLPFEVGLVSTHEKPAPPQIEGVDNGFSGAPPTDTTQQGQYPNTHTPQRSGATSRRPQHASSGRFDHRPSQHGGPGSPGTPPFSP